MEKQNDHHLSNFWSGFALGSIGVTIAAFLFGTKKGRKLLKNILEISENLEENLLQITMDLEKEVSKNPFPVIEELLKASYDKKGSGKLTINSLLNKIKDFSPGHKKSIKSFFVKEENK